LNPEDGVELCLIVKDDALEEIKAGIIEEKVGGFTKVMGVSKLKKQYREFKDKRELVSKYDAFFCDDRVVTMMPQLCGKVFFSKKKEPMPVRLSRGALGGSLVCVRDSTWLRVGAQTVSVRVGRSNFTPAQLTENILAILDPAVEKFPKKWKGVAGVHLRGLNTLGLPLFRNLSVSGLEDVEEAGEEEDNEGDEEAEDGEEEEKESQQKSKLKSKEEKKLVSVPKSVKSEKETAPKSLKSGKEMAPKLLKSGKEKSETTAPSKILAVGGTSSASASKETVKAVVPKKQDSEAASSLVSKPVGKRPSTTAPETLKEEGKGRTTKSSRK